ncbi:MAG: hypothetical protein AAGF48_15580 [Pseudomonadota bacterium]
MNDHINTHPPLPGQGHPQPDMSGQWLSVVEAAALSAEMGLSRDVKTIRRWAQRSHAQPESAEVFVREQDTPTGFRYVIEKTSLERKIAQELAFEAKRTEEDKGGQARPGPDMPAHVPLQETQENLDRTVSDTPAPVHPGPDMSGNEVEEAEQVRKLTVSTVTDGFLKDQIDQKDRQIEELNAQIERRDLHIDAMLERDKETNFLINTLQEALSQAMGLESPTRMQLRARGGGDSPASGDHRDTV